jgi:hypothetical protein
MKRPGLIERGWLAYAERILPANAPEIQKIECRRAFYAGAVHLFGALNDEVGPDDVSEDQGLAVFDLLAAEIEQYVGDLQKGRR